MIQIQLEGEDYGPATKFLPIIKEFHSTKINKTKSQLIMICDDDYYYHPHTVFTLNAYSVKYPNSIVGLRGWRSKKFYSFFERQNLYHLAFFHFLVRKDFIWGVRLWHEKAYHIVESHHLSEIYRVGVVTANYGYLIRPSFFDSHIYLDFNQVPDDIRHVDDIWLSGQASRQNIPRFIVPSCCPHISITRTHALQERLGRHQMTRFSTNHHALQWFNQSWEKDLWYKFHGVNRPKYRNWWTMLHRESVSVLLKLRFIGYFGFVYV